MRRVLAMCVAAAVLLALAGCTADAEPSWAERNAEFVVLGSAVPTPTPSNSAMPGLAASSIPAEAFADVPGAERIVVASGTPVVTREQAIAAAKPKTGTLVSAVDVLLPAEMMAEFLTDQNAKPTTAWVMTWTGVTQRKPGKGSTSRGTAPKVLVVHGDTTVVIDATTGKRIAVSEYPTP